MDGGFFLLSWLIVGFVGFLAALVFGKILRKAKTRDDKPSIPVWRLLERRIKVRRGRDHGVEVFPWHQVDQRHGFGRRHTDRPRKLP